jgi:putative heme degradation protein
MPHTLELGQRPRAATCPLSARGRRYSTTPNDVLTGFDLAEAAADRPLSLTDLRAKGRVTAVDTDLVPCFLEALSEQALPIRVVTGRAGIVLKLDGTFHMARRDAGWAELQGDTTGLRIEVSGIASAWVLEVHGPSGERGSLRLYDQRSHLLASLSAEPGRDGAEHPIWRALLSALIG